MKKSSHRELAPCSRAPQQLRHGGCFCFTFRTQFFPKPSGDLNRHMNNTTAMLEQTKDFLHAFCAPVPRLKIGTSVLREKKSNFALVS